MWKRFGPFTHQQQSEEPRCSLPNGFPAGVRRVVDFDRGVKAPFALGDRVVVDDADLGTVDELAVIGYEEGLDATTWYLGDWVRDWRRHRADLLRALDQRAARVDPSSLGAVRATLDVWIANLDTRPDLFEGAIVAHDGDRLRVAGYVIRGDQVAFVLREDASTARADHPTVRRSGSS